MLLVVWGYVGEHCSSMIYKVMMDDRNFVHLSSFVYRHLMVDLSGDELLI